jgi:glycosyltransferase involved in cell wall biosynthesis
VVSTFLKAAFGHRRRHCMTVIEDPIEVPAAVAKTSYATSGTLLELLHIAGEPPGAYGLQLVLAAGKQTRLTEISAPQKPQGPDDVDLTPRADRRFTRIVQGAGRLIGTGNPYDLAWKVRWKWYRRLEARRIHGAANIDWGERLRRIDWSPEVVWDQLMKADVGVIPCELEHEWSLAKSGNRLLMFMAAGLPVVVSPLPAYVTLMKEAGAESWLVARTPDDWRQALIRLEDPTVRQSIGERFRVFARKSYSLARIADRYLLIFQQAELKDC